MVRDRTRGERYCKLCGIAIDEPPTELPGYLGLIDLREMGAGSYASIDSDGEDLPHWNALHRMRLWKTLGSSGQRDLVLAQSRMNELSTRLELSWEIHEDAAQLYRLALGNRLLKGHDISCIVIAAIYLAHQRAGNDRSLADLCDCCGLPTSDAEQDLKVFTEDLGLGLVV
jgi:transcription initiation factor TFIIIB Brf1 subunit/transcription initiation factor TFIIB